ncbi:hypothetical protein CS063_02580 [Sporanaerobium hydrogeniformans]|uniref:Uncharacterized protein n=1 Tax=Sporanaerobium hydrogeniformans TaxID=3072179 RepID=A0AC61DKC2_9FIRM|nr:HAMP domain-containing sensor histidine kinase [Sporanaerobium hydrogeniformans]PHV72382.1 hypothetical protein CS063_02580 [Sporanaerobium hydrogeniformans]
MEYKNRMGSWVQIREIKKKIVFPTLFSRLVTVYISILVVTLIVLFVAFTNAFQSYFVEYTQNIMIKQATGLAEEYYQIGTYSTSREDILAKMMYRIKVMDSYLESTTWLIDRNYGVVVVSEHASQNKSQIIVPNQKDVQQVLEGNIVRIENGFKEYFSTPVLTIGYPIQMRNEVQYALFIHTPMPLILRTIDEVRNIILKVVAITGTIVFLWIYMISKQMSKPLKQMNAVAKQIASGQFSKRIEVSGRDEIAQLGLSLNNMAYELNKIEDKRKKFLANVSHDLRSPLTSIQGFVTAILDGTIPPESAEKYLKIVLNESRRMITMTNTILELSRVEEGVTPLRRVSFHMGCLVKSSLASFEPIMHERKIGVFTHFEKDEPYVWGDIDMMSRVLQNLMDNAFKFVNEGGRIEITTKLKYGKLWTVVSNTGSYIPEEEQKEIWDRFYKGDGSRGKDKKGLGLGLVIVKEILKQHDENIKVNSSEKDGMVSFCFSLPLAKDVSNHKI